MYTFDSKVRYSEMDQNGKLSIPSIVNYFQDCSTFQCERMGIGLQYYKDQGKTWMLAHWHIILDQAALLEDEIEIATWPHSFDRSFGYRSYYMKSAGTFVARADSKWLLFDRQKGRPVRIEPEDMEIFEPELSPKLQMEGHDGRLRMPKEYEEKDVLTVRHFLLDTNGHVNNEKYIMIAMEYVPKELNVHEVIVEYKKQAVLGSRMKICTSWVEHGVLVSLMDEEETGPYALVEFLEDF